MHGQSSRTSEHAGQCKQPGQTVHAKAPGTCWVRAPQPRSRPNAAGDHTLAEIAVEASMKRAHVSHSKPASTAAGPEVSGTCVTSCTWTRLWSTCPHRTPQRWVGECDQLQHIAGHLCPHSSSGLGLWVCHQLPPGRACGLPRPACPSGAGRRAGAQALDLRVGGVARGLAQLRGLQREAHGGPLRLGRARVHVARVLRRRRIRLAARLTVQLSTSHRSAF